MNKYLQLGITLAVDWLDVKDVAAVVDGELLLLDGGLAWVLGVEDLIELLESAVLGLWDPHPDDGGLDNTPCCVISISSK